MADDCFVSVDLGLQMENQTKSDSNDEPEKVTEKEAPRKEAGFEWAAEPDEMLFPCAATKFIMLGIAAFLVLISIITWIVSSYYTGFVWLTISTLFMALIIFLPEYFSNIINFAVNFCVWVAFTLFCLVYAIKHLADRGGFKDDSEWNQELRNKLMLAAIFEFIEFLISMLVVLLMFRMLYYYYQNRGDESVMAVAA